MSTLDSNQQPWVWKVADPLPKFDPIKENETYQEVRKEVTIVEWDAKFS